MKSLSGRPKRCKVCRREFMPKQSFQSWCSPECGLKIARDKLSKERAKFDKAERKEIKSRKEKLKPRGYYVQQATSAAQAYRRVYELSIGSGCMSCGKSQEEVEAAQGWKTGGAWDGGHLFSKGARPELRLVENNIWLQCKACNGGSSKYARKGESVREGFKAGVIERIGLEAYEALEADHEPRHYTIDDLKAITAKYRAMVRELKKEAEYVPV